MDVVPLMVLDRAQGMPEDSQRPLLPPTSMLSPPNSPFWGPPATPLPLSPATVRMLRPPATKC